MENIKSESNSAKGAQLDEMPSKETIRQWVKRDVGAAAYFLSMILKDPETLNDLADILYERYRTDREDQQKLDE